MQLHPDISEFVLELRALEILLTKYGATHWADSIRLARLKAEKSDAHSVVLFLRLFGGMGSLNDFMLNAPANIVWEYEQHLTKAHHLADILK